MLVRQMIGHSLPYGTAITRPQGGVVQGLTRLCLEALVNSSLLKWHGRARCATVYLAQVTEGSQVCCSGLVLLHTSGAQSHHVLLILQRFGHCDIWCCSRVPMVKC